ncbi:dual specificity mitogen-activated protein kinase kinase 5-like [Watersipora subatra]|uniref:dual specificity mitogen-activated protein kinase kinase 5-like n=1 Tax=Watersipora subatra TaxID=2589382 RepID=UPI00355B1D3E
MAAHLPPFSLEIFSHDQTQLAVLNVTNPSEQLTYFNIIGAIQHYLPQTTIHAFQYVDDEGDYITVRTDRETAEMIKAYVTANFDRSSNAFVAPLMIYPSNDSVQEPGSAGLKNRPNLHVEVPGSAPIGKGSGGSVHQQSTSSSGGIQSASPMNLNHGSATSHGTGSPDSIKLASIMNAPLSADADPLSLDQLVYDPGSDRLGAGNGGSVFKVYHKTMGTTVALKIIGLDATSAAEQKQIISELSILHRCKSPFIISFCGAFFHGNEIYIATELMDGGSLDRYQPIIEPVLGRIAVMVVHGLQYLWSRGIMHRDVKPSNMLVNTVGIVKLCDFGVSRQLINSTALTYCGTHAYMSPERLNESKGYKIQSDLWSLGVSLYEMAEGVHPFPTESLASPVPLFKSIVEGKISSLPRAKFSASFCLFVSQCLMRAPEQRPHPKALIDHPFIVTYNDGNTGIVAEYVKNRLSAGLR